jgi:glycosyltransferase involved in cell wall biosynthesis
MSYSVLSIAYPLTPVGEDAAGGSEQILTLLDRGLVEAGHKSLVIAAEGSSVRGTLIPAPRARGRIDDGERRWARKIHHSLIQDALATHPVDIIHMHSLDFHRYLPKTSLPVLATLHLPPDWYPADIFCTQPKNLHLNCVSYSQQKACPKGPSSLAVIPNGVDVSRLETSAPKRKYALALGRICPEKGFHFAIDAAKEADYDLVLAGEVIPYEAHQEYFRQKIDPRLDNRRRFVGPVGFSRKKSLLAEASCLLIASTVEETSSLVAMEALAAGTPVIAYRVGALPEIIEHGRTGYLVSNVQEMARAIAEAEKLDSEECRKVARKRFSSRQMQRRYFEMYERLVGKNSVRVGPAKAAPGASWLVNW